MKEKGKYQVSKHTTVKFYYINCYLFVFSVVAHLVVHLPYETKVVGRVSYTRMYLIKRSLRTSKRYVRNKARPERSIVEAYVMNELGTFCSRYLSGFETWFTRDERNDDTIPEDEGDGELKIFKQKVQNATDLYKRHQLAFPEWFQNQVLYHHSRAISKRQIRCSLQEI
ncbi:uncharacterized protein E5676_scaffold491G00120 [Cucumis melo var. makuwa]|uniref:DUF4218 domain-containing protein n=1 Tax=Cucumis melo var. makuwa TaxID=1194695 RepID=A0A5A7VG56_CUCMM|nr:uncharacterized protein E6C27_scaffold1343G00090 [Cucumis melo var. makuwa]TYJ97706.1 uncharacterized protein E5676_scaffold491G00120 [Cucumis melo var. makuwa]